MTLNFSNKNIKLGEFIEKYVMNLTTDIDKDYSDSIIKIITQKYYKKALIIRCIQDKEHSMSNAIWMIDNKDINAITEEQFIKQYNKANKTNINNIWRLKVLGIKPKENSLIVYI